MSKTSSTNPCKASRKISRPRSGQASKPKARPVKGTDDNIVSLVRELTAKARELPDVRPELVEQVKAEIADGTYETPEKMDTACEELLKDLLDEA